MIKRQRNGEPLSEEITEFVKDGFYCYHLMELNLASVNIKEDKYGL